MSTSTGGTFVGMVQTFPVRTLLFTFGPLVFALSQVINSYVNDTSLLPTLAFGGLMVAFAVLITRYHLATFRLSRLIESETRSE